jgi:hypothetical protein
MLRELCIEYRYSLHDLTLRFWEDDKVEEWEFDFTRMTLGRGKIEDAPEFDEPPYICPECRGEYQEPFICEDCQEPFICPDCRNKKEILQ